MAESKFLPYQDINGDGLVDACDEVLNIVPPLNCPTCVPNPNAPIPDWRKRKIFEPFLNQRVCRYQITVRTNEDTTNASSNEAAEAAMETNFNNYVDLAVDALLDIYNKDKARDVVQVVKDAMEYTDYNLDYRPKSRLKLLYSVSSDLIDSLEDASMIATDEESIDAGDIVITYKAHELSRMLLIVRKTLALYGRYLKVHRAINGKQIMRVQEDIPFNLADYGDFGFDALSSLMGSLLPHLEGFLNTRGYKIPYTADTTPWKLGGNWTSKEKVEALEFTFTNEYVLKKMKVYSETCPQQPVEFKNLSAYYSDLENATAISPTATDSLGPETPATKQARRGTAPMGPLMPLLNNQESGWSDPTAMAYFASLKLMEIDATARVPMSWVEYVVKHTYPQVAETTIDYTVETSDTVSTCIADALANEGKQLAEDLLDDTFNLGDAIAYKFNENLCKKDRDEVLDEESKLGLIDNPDYPDYDTIGDTIPSGETDSKEPDKKITLWALAKMQAYEELESDSITFESLCGSLLENGDLADTSDKIREVFKELKYCGLMDLFTEAIGCLMAGRSLEEGLASIIDAALKGMSINNFGILFAGLPVEKQQELDALVKEKIESGDIFQQGTILNAASDGVAGNYTSKRPWENSAGSRDARTLVISYDSLTDTGLSDDSIMEAYIQTMIEVYGEDLFELIDELNKFPGAQLISNTLATVTCPTTSLFKPTVFEFIKDVELPFCRSIDEFVFPKWTNPFAWIPEWADFWKILSTSATEALNELIVTALTRFFVKICETLGSAACQALETTGDLATSAAMGVVGRNSVAEFIKDGICGDDADQETVNNTVADMFGLLGLGATALANKENIISFTEALSSAVTRKELANAFLCDASPEFLDIVDIIIEYEYPEYRSALGNKTAIKGFFCNLGSLLPIDFRGDLRNFVNELPPGDQLPANPSLCATPEQIEDFCAARAQLLEGRASPSQIADLCKPEPFIEMPSFEAPIVSDPGCNNGIFPFEPEGLIASAVGGIGGELEGLKVDYATDMLGNGPREKDWGFINMILSDTDAQPLTAHYRRVANRKNYVDYYTSPDFSDDSGASDSDKALSTTSLNAQKAAFPRHIAKWLSSSMLSQADSLTYNSNNLYIEDQLTTKTFYEIGLTRYPLDPLARETAGAGLIDATLRGGPLVAAYNVGALAYDVAAPSVYALKQQINFDPLSMPEFGYNIVLSASMEDNTITFIEKGRKEEPDLLLSFGDNAKGKYTGPEAVNLGDDKADTPAYGFDIGFYLADLYMSDGVKVNRPYDNTRIKIVENFNPSVLGLDWDIGLLDILLAANPITGPVKVIQYMSKLKEQMAGLLAGQFEELKYEFLATDNTLEGIDLDPYPKMLATFQNKNSYAPQVVLLDEMLDDAGSSLSLPDVKSLYDNVMTQITKDIFTMVASNETAFRYGAQYDNLGVLDVQYGIVADGSTYYYKDTDIEDDPTTEGEWLLYTDVRIVDATSGELRKLKNKDMILGISYMEYKIEHLGLDDENRVFYLNPADYGGTYKSPALYIAPEKNEGWLGIVDALFPDISPCKPQTTEFVDFGEIQDMISEIYQRLPEDERLRYDPNCAIEVPYNRVLTRPSKAAIQGLVMAAIRMYASQHLIKSMATITTFDPRFPQIYSSIYAYYIIEVMEESFKDAQSDFAENFTPFKDEEFWYAFLEQSVQMYSDMVEAGKITPPPMILEALMRLNDMQEQYEAEELFTKSEFKKNRPPDAGKFQTYKDYKSEKVLEAVQATEEDAKIILSELVMREINFMSRKLMKNLKKIGITPSVRDINYFLLENYCQGSSLTLNENVTSTGAIREEYTNLPTEGEYLYTNGDELAVSVVHDPSAGYSKGDEYTGYYHVNISDGDSGLIYMAGAYHTDDSHNVLTPIATEIRVPIGDVDDYNVTATSDNQKPFVIEKYMLIDGTRYSTSAGLSRVKSKDNNLNISDAYPGTLELEYDSSGNIIGLTGELGVRLGLSFSMVVDDTKYEITSVEIDALDVSIGKFKGLNGDTKELLCLINHLKGDDKFRLIANYVFPFGKIVSTTAVYNDMGFIPSIGEITSATGQAWGHFLRKIDDDEAKPGAYADITYDEDSGTAVGFTTDTGNTGWASYTDRKRGNPFFLEYDEWDTVPFKNVKANLKRLFKKHYHFKDFTPPDLFPSMGPGQLYLGRLKGLLKPVSAAKLLPWWKRRKLRTNPFNANGELCEKE